MPITANNQICHNTRTVESIVQIPEISNISNVIKAANMAKMPKWQKSKMLQNGQIVINHKNHIKLMREINDYIKYAHRNLAYWSI